MSTFEILMPKMGESVEEATITKWFVSVGDTIEEDDLLLEIATDKVDSEIPSPVAGTVKEILYDTDALVPVGKPVAVIALQGDESEGEAKPESSQVKDESSSDKQDTTPAKTAGNTQADQGTKESGNDTSVNQEEQKSSDKFYSPLVKSIAKKEGVSFKELDTIKGSGQNERVTKADILNYIEQRASGSASDIKEAKSSESAAQPVAQITRPPVSVSAEDEIVQMDRMRKMIAEHMVMSKQVSPHVTAVVEVDMTNIVMWRNKNKEAYQKKHGEKITYTPIFFEATAKALRDFPGVNTSVDGDKIIYRKDVNIGMAVALPSGNLIVPVIKNADHKNLVGLTSDVNKLANQARNNKLSPDDIQGGTFTITNFGSFKNILGTPIINQPQVAILAVGSIEKKPAVIETPTGDAIAIRHKMFLSLSYDHRIVDGALGGNFLRRIGDYLEQFDMDRVI
ncbi:2-oxoglutarate dehydrogenase E2 component (dihydrolipoamide succinyltransferase) [Saccharicrinis carchari]|uniref:Dihydrolipoamide acetyltransferase component of pyruvate dehydrogenase complex n=1 Tax=Saccharicrinis carchari TaxID=1168039 RepID=A0A521AVN4_SACCC|nr:dihydrolipoamide acetyltransferase family protein [Saccharicrinis carchari]SMO38898.1 2-oxoglutarate dehydrogenase E2 component (dihydrolipoamide succinyltransferase) [Saccharicrinis carchari]